MVPNKMKPFTLEFLPLLLFLNFLPLLVVRSRAYFFDFIVIQLGRCLNETNCYIYNIWKRDKKSQKLEKIVWSILVPEDRKYIISPLIFRTV